MADDNVTSAVTATDDTSELTAHGPLNAKSIARTAGHFRADNAGVLKRHDIVDYVE